MLFRTLSRVTLAALLSVPLAAQGGGPGGGPGRGPDPMLLLALDLTEAQQTALEALLERHRPAEQAKAEAGRTSHEALEAAMVEPATTVEQLKALHDAAAQAQYDLLLEHRAVLQEGLALLTPEQKARLAKLQKGAGSGRMRALGGLAGPGMPPPGKR